MNIVFPNHRLIENIFQIKHTKQKKYQQIQFILFEIKPAV